MNKELKKTKCKKKINHEKPDEVILNSHIISYLNKVGNIIFWLLLLLTITEILIFFLVKMGYFSYYLEKQNNVKLSYDNFIGESTVKLIITWLIFSIYLILYNKVSFPKKKVLVCIMIFTLTTIFCFGHWKYSYLSILYSIPIVLTSPLGRKTQKTVLVFSVLISLFYSFFQYETFKTEYNFLIGTVTIVTLIAFYLICSSFYDSMIKTIMDMEKFYNLSAKLSDEISHDYVTGAFSKVILDEDLEKCKTLKSIAFIDLDDFKNINDTKGHSVGDHILKNIVRCFNSRNERIYRYGGDEFVVLSDLSVDDLAKKIELIKTAYNTSSKKLFACNATFSAGVMSINKEDDTDTLLRKCDRVMYISKHEGKNKISVKK